MLVYNLKVNKGWVYLEIKREIVKRTNRSGV